MPGEWKVRLEKSLSKWYASRILKGLDRAFYSGALQYGVVVSVEGTTECVYDGAHPFVERRRGRLYLSFVCRQRTIQ